MFDPGAAQAVLKQLNRWYRKRAKPRGEVDYYYRGTRMVYTAINRRVVCGFSLLLLSAAVALCFVPGVTTDKSLAMTIFLKSVWLGIVALAILAPSQLFREFAVVTDDGLIKSDLFGRVTRMNWREISNYQIKPDDNKVIFISAAKTKLTMSLSYDGWQDFREMAARRLSPVLYWQLNTFLANLDAKNAIARPPNKIRFPRWFAYERKR